MLSSSHSKTSKKKIELLVLLVGTNRKVDLSKQPSFFLWKEAAASYRRGGVRIAKNQAVRRLRVVGNHCSKVKDIEPQPIFTTPAVYF